MSIKLFDRIYGEVEIDEEILIDLIGSKPITRLKGISQNGMPDEYYHKPGFSRYEHSIGVMILLRRLGASIEEQIAGLLHDISHTAFSHVVDWVMGDSSKEDYQDNVYEEYFINSEIPSILEQYGFDYKEFIDLEKYSLLEQNAPKLCADRFDYSIREMVEFYEIEDIDRIIAGVKNIKGRMMFDDLEAAELFSKGYAKCNEEHWCGVEAKARYLLLSDILRMAMSKKIISKDDFWKTDKEVIDKILLSEDSYFSDRFDLLRDKLKIVEEKDGFLLKKKFRYIDPEVIIDNKIKKLSEVSLEYKKLLDEKIKGKNGDIKVKIMGHHE